jgi:ferredoxin
MASEVTIDADLCIGSGDCVRLLPDAFRIDEDLGVAVPLAPAANTPVERLRQAALGCPTNAIAVVDAEGRIIVASNG